MRGHLGGIALRLSLLTFVFPLCCVSRFGLTCSPKKQQPRQVVFGFAHLTSSDSNFCGRMRRCSSSTSTTSAFQQILHARHRGSAFGQFWTDKRETVAAPPPPRPAWPRLFCTTISHGPEVHTGDIGQGEQWDHSNPKIRLLLERYRKVCAEVPQEFAPTQGAMKPENVAGTDSGDPAMDDSRSPSRAVFSNNLVDLSRIEVVGFDYDYTLATYTQDLQVLIYDLAKRHLVEELKYPTGLISMRYDKEFAIMGLTVDMEKGLLCKLSYINRMSTPVLRGRTPLTRDEIKAEYGSYPVMVSPEYRNKVLKPLNDRFCLAEACLLADVMQYLQQEAGRRAFHPRAVVEDVLSSIKHVHVSGMMHERVLADIGKYIQPSHQLELMLQTLRNAGKKLFISSNSPWGFVSAGMEHMLGKDWKDLFEFVGVSASKPLFYTGNRPFRLVSKSTGRIKWSEVTYLEQGGVFTHGSIEELRRLKGWNGPSVLYFGDSLWADLVEARKLHGWTTGAIIYDVELELEKMATPEYRRLSHHAQALEVLLPLVQEAAEQGDGEDGASRHMGDEDHALLDALEMTRARLKRRISDMANCNFGSIFRTSDEPTLFAFSLWRHVDLYTSRVSNLVNFGVTHRFYPTKTLSVAHEPKFDSGAIHRAILHGSEGSEEGRRTV